MANYSSGILNQAASAGLNERGDSYDPDGILNRSGYSQMRVSASLKRSDASQYSDWVISKHFKDVCNKQYKDLQEVSPLFSRIMTCVIIVNCLQIGFECQWDRRENDIASIIYRVLDALFVTMYLLEVILKLCKHGLKSYFCDPGNRHWNCIDILLTFTMCLDVVLPIFGSTNLHSSLKKLFLLRFVRMVRVLRLLRAVPDLSLLLEGLVGSSTRLIWIVSLLCLLIYIFAILFTIEVEPETYEENYFSTLTSSMSTLLNVVIGAEWNSVAEPLLKKQPFLMLPLLVFLIIGSFGILNCIVGVIVDTTADTKDRFLSSDKLKQLRGLSDMWVDQLGTENEDLGHDDSDRLKIIDVLDHMIKAEIVSFPAGCSAEEVFDVLDSDGTGGVTHEEFVIGIGQLLLGNPFQLTCQQFINEAQNRKRLMRTERRMNELAEDMNARMSSMEKLLESLAKQFAK